GYAGRFDAQPTAFEATFDVSDSGVIRGRILDYDRAREATVAGEQEGEQIRFLKMYTKKAGLTRSNGVEYWGQIAPDGQSISGNWRLTSRVLGIPMSNQGFWSASRVSGQNVPPSSQFPT
ncbi:MAG TPA: hypothetical protein VFW40_03455, partial [Capsulimonadaceae bacterium]|nr:hypothetical protein [Capsulimonadaceae bacterium]